MYFFKYITQIIIYSIKIKIFSVKTYLCLKIYVKNAIIIPHIGSS